MKQTYNGQMDIAFTCHLTRLLLSIRQSLCLGTVQLRVMKFGQNIDPKVLQGMLEVRGYMGQGQMPHGSRSTRSR